MATATGQPEPERFKGASAGASHPQTSGSSERPSDPSKKYWWLAAVIVPVVVALIGIVPSFLNTASGSQYITNNQLDGDMYFTTNISVEDPTLQEEVRRAVELAQQKQYAQSAKAFEALAAQIQSAEIYNNLGVVQAAAGNMGPARTAYQQALALDPQFQGAHLNIGLIDKAEGKWIEAKEHFDRAGELRGAAGKVDEIDRHFGNNDILNATPIKVEATVSAEIVAPEDMDFYEFTAPPEPRDHLRVSLTNRSTTLSPSFHFFDGKKGQVTSHSNGTPGADLSFDLAAQPNETFYVHVFGRGLWDAPSSAGSYTLSVSP
jgi:tetratricopeptide (TPR) repeat protein